MGITQNALQHLDPEIDICENVSKKNVGDLSRISYSAADLYSSHSRASISM